MKKESSITISLKATIQLAGNDIDCYRDNKGKDYVSSSHLAESIGLDRNSTLQNRISKELKAFLGTGFRPVTFSYSGTTIQGWRPKDCAKFWFYHAKKENFKATALVLALIQEPLERRIHSAHGTLKSEEYIEKETEWNRLRHEGKSVRKDFSSAVSRHNKTNKVSGSEKHTSFAEATNLIYKLVLGKTAKIIIAERNPKCDNARELLTSDELHKVRLREESAAFLLELNDYEPPLTKTIHSVHSQLKDIGL